MVNVLQQVSRLQMPETVEVQLRAGGDVLEGRAVWVDPGRAHIELDKRLPGGTEGTLRIRLRRSRVRVIVKVLAVTKPAEGAHHRHLHLCALDVPPAAQPAFEALLRAVNPSLAPPPPQDPETRRPARSTRTDPEAEETPRRSRSRRLPPQRRLSSRIPKPTDEPLQPRRRTSGPTRRGPRGLAPDELVKTVFHRGTPPVLEAVFVSAELWSRSARLGPGWLQLVLAQCEDIEEQDEVYLDLELPTGAVCSLHGRIARAGRGRMLVEIRDLPPAVQESMKKV